MSPAGFRKMLPARKGVPAHMENTAMLILSSYPDLFGVADNNPYGLKVFDFLKLCRLAFRTSESRPATSARGARW